MTPILENATTNVVSAALELAAPTSIQIGGVLDVGAPAGGKFDGAVVIVFASTDNLLWQVVGAATSQDFVNININGTYFVRVQIITAGDDTDLTVLSTV